MENKIGIEVTEEVERAIEDCTLGLETLTLEVVGTSTCVVEVPEVVIGVIVPVELNRATHSGGDVEALRVLRYWTLGVFAKFIRVVGPGVFRLAAVLVAEGIAVHFAGGRRVGAAGIGFH